MPNPTAAILVIGDEILSGRTQDTNIHFLACELTPIGIDLKEIRVVPDTPDAIITAVNALGAVHTHVFTSGGIGPTHDDITADAMAAAFGVGISVRDDARALLRSLANNIGIELNDARLRMARIPDGASLIKNSVSWAPGFTLENVHVMAGVPSVFRAMVTAVLPGLTGGSPQFSTTLRINRGEGDIAKPLADLAADNPDLALGSYPFWHEGVYGADVVIRGLDEAAVLRVGAALRAIFPEDKK